MVRPSSGDLLYAASALARAAENTRRELTTAELPEPLERHARRLELVAKWLEAEARTKSEAPAAIAAAVPLERIACALERISEQLGDSTTPSGLLRVLALMDDGR